MCLGTGRGVDGDTKFGPPAKISLFDLARNGAIPSLWHRRGRYGRIWVSIIPTMGVSIPIQGSKIYFNLSQWATKYGEAINPLGQRPPPLIYGIHIALNGVWNPCVRSVLLLFLCTIASPLPGFYCSNTVPYSSIHRECILSQFHWDTRKFCLRGGRSPPPFFHISGVFSMSL